MKKWIIAIIVLFLAVMAVDSMLPHGEDGHVEAAEK